jgi:hypothetical protein
MKTLAVFTSESNRHLPDHELQLEDITFEFTLDGWLETMGVKVVMATFDHIKGTQMMHSLSLERILK